MASNASTQRTHAISLYSSFRNTYKGRISYWNVDFLQEFWIYLVRASHIPHACYILYHNPRLMGYKYIEKTKTSSVLEICWPSGICDFSKVFMQSFARRTVYPQNKHKKFMSLSAWKKQSSGWTILQKIHFMFNFWAFTDKVTCGIFLTIMLLELIWRN